MPVVQVENTVEKGEIAHNKQFLLFPQCFLPVWRTICYLHQTCHLLILSVWKSLKFVVWERVKGHLSVLCQGLYKAGMSSEGSIFTVGYLNIG